MTTIEGLVQAHNKNNGNFTGRTMSPAVQKIYAAEMRGTRAMFEGLTKERPEVRMRDKDDAERYSSDVNTRVGFQPVDMGMHDVEGRPRQVLVQPVQYIYSEGCTHEYPDAIPGDTSSYELEVFAVKEDTAVDVGTLEEALYEGSEELDIELVHLGTEHLLVYEPDADGSYDRLDSRVLQDAFEFNPLLREVYLQSQVAQTTPAA